jgi:hypothetical protein
MLVLGLAGGLLCATFALAINVAVLMYRKNCSAFALSVYKAVSMLTIAGTGSKGKVLTGCHRQAHYHEKANCDQACKI